MKTKSSKIFFVLLVFSLTSVCVKAQIFVKIQPVAPVIVVSPQPSSFHVWIGEEWEPFGGGYRYIGGHWDKPPHSGDRWNQGHWNHDANKGHQWVRGNWKGRK